MVVFPVNVKVVVAEIVKIREQDDECRFVPLVAFPAQRISCVATAGDKFVAVVVVDVLQTASVMKYVPGGTTIPVVPLSRIWFAETVVIVTLPETV